MSSFFQRKFSEIFNLFPLLSFSLTARDLHPYAKVNIPCSLFAFSLSIPGPATAFFLFPPACCRKGSAKVGAFLLFASGEAENI